MSVSGGSAENGIKSAADGRASRAAAACEGGWKGLMEEIAMRDAGPAAGRFRAGNIRKIRDVGIYYLVACLFMGISAFLSGLQWSEANGVREYLRLVLFDKPFITLVALALFVLAGVMMQIGKRHFKLTYYEISIIWLATSWVSLVILWLISGIKPAWAELVGIAFCQGGLAVSTIARMRGEPKRQEGESPGQAEMIMQACPKSSPEMNALAGFGVGKE